jgi:uncharacterized protein (TIGR02996 family)
MTQDEAFLQTIIECPDDDAPRLIYADWLEENGDPDRAEFIREQIRLARGGEENPLWRGGSQRAEELLLPNRDKWVKRLPEWARRNGAFRQGFVSSVRCTARQFLQGGAALCRATPLEGVYIERLSGLSGPFANYL